MNVTAGNPLGVAGSPSGMTTSSSATNSGTGGPSVPPGNVPSQYESLYGGLQTALNTANQDISGWNGGSYPVHYAVELINADAQIGPGVLNRLPQIDEELDSDQAMGVGAVVLEAGFPLFDQTFYSYAGSSYAPQQFISFYQSVIAAIHAHGMKVVIEANPLETVQVGGTNNPLNPTAFYQSLTWQQYVAQRGSDDVTIAQQIKPDYLILQSEPTTDALQVRNHIIAGQINDPSADTQMIGQIVTELNNANISGLHTSIDIGSGLGLWQTSNWQQYLSGLTAISGLDKIDMHMYFFGPSDPSDEVATAIRVASAAHAAGKGVSMSEFWPTKTAIPYSQIFTADSPDSVTDEHARQTYSFWEPLDEQYLSMLVKLANYKQYDYVSPFMGLGTLDWAYLDYSSSPCRQVYPANGTNNTVCDDEILKTDEQLAAAALASHRLSPTGQDYNSYIVSLPKP